MSKYLKGNYDLGDTPEEPKPDTAEATADAEAAHTTEEFEEKALERLGGSIAFVIKPKTFLWTGEDEGAE